ncbi:MULTISPECIES: autotransporter domain-containing protein [unclassified Pseudomonas]|uniref:autotransporter domain-containing protein n=1 Tax=unclassified Pseudomonas TaxID=196821 RepID=UPI0021153D48|nr:MULTISPECIES: autotransporter domain-containing protein [unclassified Pseudomonas]
MAQSVTEQTRPFETTAEMQARLKAFAAAPDTKIDKVIKARETPLSKDDSNDLVLVSRQGELIGLTDGGGGANVLQLEIAKGGELGEIRNIQDVYLKRGEWSNDKDFDSRNLIDSNAKLINTGRIGGSVHVLGEFANQGSVVGPVFVGKKARFSGSGTVDALDVAGSMEVGPDMGAPSVANDLRFSKGATLVYGVDAKKGSATIKVGGTATLDNAILKIAAVPGEYIDTSRHIVIDADKIEGEFGKIVNDLAYMTATVDYTTGKQVGLIYTRNNIPLEDVATTENGKVFGASVLEPQPHKPSAPEPVAVAAALPPAANPQPHRPTLKPAEPSEIARATPKSVEPSRIASATPTPPEPSEIASTTPNPAEPSKIANAVTTTAESSKIASAAPTTAEPSKLTSAAPTTAAQAQTTQPAPKPNAAINALLGSNLVTAADALDQLSGYDTADLGNATLSSVAPISTGMLAAMGQNTPQGAHGNGQVWVQAIGNSGRVGKHLDDYALKHSTTGLLLGTDWAINPTWRLGIIGAKSETRLDSHRFDGRLDSWHVGAYAVRQDGPLALRLGAVHGNHDGSTKRQVAFNGFSDRLKGRYDANTQQVFGQIGYNLDVGHVDIEPYLQLGYQRYQRDRYTEKGGDAALRFNGQTQDNYNSNVGLRLDRAFPLDQGMQLTPRLNLGWKHLYGKTRGTSRQRLAGAGNTYTVEGVELDRDSLLFETGLDLAVSPRHTLGVSYKGETGQDNRNGALMGQWRMMF